MINLRGANVYFDDLWRWINTDYSGTEVKIRVGLFKNDMMNRKIRKKDYEF